MHRSNRLFYLLIYLYKKLRLTSSLNSFLILFDSRVLLSGFGLDGGDGAAGFVRGGAVRCRGGDGTPGFAGRHAQRYCATRE